MTLERDVLVSINNDYISGEIVFETLWDSRLVNYNISALHVLRIKKWLAENGFEFKSKLMDGMKISL
jgi:hypothetical protein